MWQPESAQQVRSVILEGSVKSWVVSWLGLLSSTPAITFVGGFPFTPSAESPCASEAHSLFLAGDGAHLNPPLPPVAWEVCPLPGRGSTVARQPPLFPVQTVTPG